MENESKPAGSKRMEMLQQSLAKKQTAFDNKIQAHFDDVQSANGQPHYSEKIIDRLAAHHGWDKEDGKTASKTIEGGYA